jgi:secondary thiamine-phosphate synthase enzyme
LVRILRENLTMDSHVITVRTGDRPAVNDVTAEAQAFVDAYAHGGDGLLHVFVPHATAGIAIIETGAGSDDDLLTSIDEVLPLDGRWRHRHGSPGHGRDHVLPAYISPSATFPVISGRIALGTWQSICLVDPNVDNAVRQVRFSFLAG